jgi:hypothetical protein
MERAKRGLEPSDEALYTDGCAAALLLEAERRRLTRDLTALAEEGPGAHTDRARELERRLDEVSHSLRRLRRRLRRMRPTDRRSPTRFRSGDAADAPAAALAEEE